MRKADIDDRGERAVAGDDQPHGFRERRVASLFEEVLGVPVDRAETDFFASGGDDRAAARLLDVIEEDAGVRLAPDAVTQHPTVRSLARLLADSKATRTGRVVGYGTDLPGRPFFCIVPGFQARVIAKHFVAAAGRPFYALQRAGLEGRAFPDWTHRSRARRALRDIRAVQPQGPYMIGGYCGDGWIAYELGRLLREQGEQVDLYVCVDLWAPNTKLPFSIRIKMHERWLRVVGWLPERRGLLDLRRRALFVREIGRDWADVAKWLGLGLTAGWLRRPLTKQGKLMFMMGSPLTWRYRPPATDFDVTLVRGAPFGGYDWAVRREPRDMSWGRMTSGRVDVVEVSGDHISMLEGEKGAELGEALARLATATVARTATPAVAADARTPEPSVATG